MLTRSQVENRTLSSFNSIAYGSPIDQRVSNAKSPKRAKKIDPEPSIEFGTFVEDKQIVLVLPIRTVSEANCFEGWKKKHARHKKQKFAVQAHLNLVVNKITLPCEITLTRYASRSLDLHDNLPYSFKFISDSIADLLIPGKKSGFADSDLRLTWKYSQIKSKEYAIRIQIKSLA